MDGLPVMFNLWENGAYRLSSFDETSGAGALVQHDGRHAMRVVGVRKDGFEECIVGRRAVRGGVAINKSVLRLDADRRLVWQWSMQRPGLARNETWSIPARGPRAMGTGRCPPRTHDDLSASGCRTLSG